MEEEIIEELNQEEPEFVEGYKIKAGNTYLIKRQEYNGNVFYKIPLKQKNNDGTVLDLEKTVMFKDKPDIPDGSKVLIKKFVENGYYKKQDVRHYNPIFILLIYDWEIVAQSEQTINDAFQDYQKAKVDDDIPLF